MTDIVMRYVTSIVILTKIMTESVSEFVGKIVTDTD